MIRRLTTLMSMLAIAAFAGAQTSEFVDYINKYKKIAVREMERAGVPASIKLAQALLESDAGRSELARKANNHFGIKCGGDWNGKTYDKEDDDFDEFGNLQKSCFRKYKNSEDSYIAHSEFLRDPKKSHRYGFLFRLDPTDYRRWAQGLRKSGYATGANYDDKLIRIIETYKLFELDQASFDDFFEGRPEKGSEIIAGLDIRRVNDVKVVFAKNKITVQDISILTDVSVRSLGKYNEKLPPLSDSLAEGTRIYLQPKRCAYRGKRKWHYVQQGQTMFDLSQEYGVKLTKLYKRNRMPSGSEPQPDQRIKLKGCKVKTDERPRLQSEPKANTVPVLIDDGKWMEEGITPEPLPTTPTTKPDTTQPDTTKPDTTKPGTGTQQPSQPTDAAYHTVVKGDTLYNISKRYGTTVDELMRLNNLTSSAISIGQVLRVR
jgi:LysM repeat protein